MTGGGNKAIEKALTGSKFFTLFKNRFDERFILILNTILVHVACRARGQDPRIALQLERIVSENDNTKIMQVDYRSIDMSKSFNSTTFLLMLMLSIF